MKTVISVTFYLFALMLQLDFKKNLKQVNFPANTIIQYRTTFKSCCLAFKQCINHSYIRFYTLSGNYFNIKAINQIVS